MQDLDIRYVMVLMPIVYSIVPFLLTGNFLILGGLTLTAFILGAIVFIVLTNLHLSGEAATIGGSFSLDSEAGYSLFVIVFGGLMFLGGVVISQFLTVVDAIFAPLNTIIRFVIPSFNGFSFAGLLNVGAPNLTQVYDPTVKIMGVNVFPALDAVMGIILAVGLYFFIASRGH